MLKKSQFLRNWNPFSVVIGGCSAILSTKNCSLKDALQLGQTRFLPRAFKNCLGFKPVVHRTWTLYRFRPTSTLLCLLSLMQEKWCFRVANTFSNVNKRSKAKIDVVSVFYCSSFSFIIRNARRYQKRCHTLDSLANWQFAEAEQQPFKIWICMIVETREQWYCKKW